MPGFRVDFSQNIQSDANGDPYSGGLLYAYVNETVTPVTVYSDAAASVTAANPIVADSAGRLPARYVGADDPLTMVFKTSAGVTIWSMDDFEPVPNIANADLANYLPLDGSSSMDGPFNEAEGTAITSATSINLDAMTGSWAHVTGATGISTMTLAQGSRRLLIFDDALTITHSSNLILPNSINITTVAGDSAEVIGEGSGVTRMVRYNCVSGKPLIENAEVMVAVGDETTAITTGNAKLTFRMPFSMVIETAALPVASLTTASSSGLPLIDINDDGVSIFSTRITIDANELTSETAAAPAVLTSSPLTIAAGSVMTIDIDGAGTNAAGLKCLLRGYRKNR